MLTYEQLQAFMVDMKARQLTGKHSAHSLLILDLKTRRGPTEPDIELIVGPCEAVLDFVAARIQNDHCTPHYEHMLWSVDRVDRSANQLTGAVRMRRSRYAGD